MENGHEQFGYFSKDVAVQLDVTTSTLRRWSIALEKQGYRFDRNEKEQRIFYERDFKAFRELKKLLSHHVSFEDAINAVVSMTLENKNARQTPSVYEDEVRLSKREFKEYIDQVANEAAQRAAEETAKVMQEKLKDEFEKRDRILTQQLNESVQQKQIAATTKEEKKSWWKKLFDK